MITLKLTPTEFRSMIVFMRITCSYLDTVPLPERPIRAMVLADYLGKFSLAQLETWRNKRRDKEHTLSLTLSVARALYDEMVGCPLVDPQQNVLDKLDLAIVDYRSKPLLAY